MVMIACLIEIRNLYYPDISVHITSKGLIDGLRGLGGLQTASIASEIEIGTRFFISILNYPEIHVHIGPNRHIGGLRGHGDLQMTSEVNYDLKFELSGLNNPCSSVFLASASLYLTNTDGWEAKCHPLTRFALMALARKKSKTGTL